MPEVHWDWCNREVMVMERIDGIPVNAAVRLREAGEIARPEDLLGANRLSPNDELWAGWFAAAGLDVPPPSRLVNINGMPGLPSVGLS